MLPAAQAQVQMTPQFGNATVYRYAEPGQPTITVDIWGAIRQPGRYEIGEGTNLLDLLSLAGGPVIGVDAEGTSQNATVRLSRGEPGQRQLIFEAELTELTAAEREFPEIADGDIVSVQVKVRSRLYWRDVLTVTASVASLTYILLRIFDN